MITIPIWLLIVATVGACSAGLLATSLLAASRTTRWQKIVNASRDQLRNDRDELRERLRTLTAERDEALAAVDTACSRLHECEAVMEKIRRLLPPECDALRRTYTRS